MVKPEVHDYKSIGATCALDKDKIQRTEKIHGHGNNWITIPSKNGSENIKYRENRHLNKGYNYDKFQMMIFENPGGCESAETPVISTTMVEETTLPRNSYIEEDDDEVTDDNDEGESNNTPPNTPSLMKEIQAVIA